MIDILHESDTDWVERLCGIKIPLRQLDNRETQTLGLKIPGRGFIVGRLRGDTAYLSYLYIRPESRSQGLGKQLIEQFIMQVRELGTNRILVSGETGSAPGYVQPGVDVLQGAAINLLSMFGFRIIGTAYSMELDLTKNLSINQVPISYWKVRPAVPQDGEMLYKAISDSVSKDWANFFSRALIEETSRILIAEKNFAIGGYCHFKEGHFGPIGVLRGLRGEGLGTLLTTSTLKAMKKSGLNRAWFNWADEQNLDFYRRFGFEVFREFKRLELRFKVDI
jgi:ribosomal protein S18 acetylase RimI-like enzyme